MQVKRPHLVVRRSLLSIFLTSIRSKDKNRPPKIKCRWNNILRLIFSLPTVALAVIIAIFGMDLVSGISFLAGNELIAYAAALAVSVLLALYCAGGIIWNVMKVRAWSVEFYDSYVNTKIVLFHKIDNKCMFPKVLECNIGQNWFGRVFRFGDVYVDAIGKWDVDLVFIKNPEFVKKYLDNRFISSKEINSMRQTVVTQ